MQQISFLKNYHFLANKMLERIPLLRAGSATVAVDNYFNLNYKLGPADKRNDKHSTLPLVKQN